MDSGRWPDSARIGRADGVRLRPAFRGRAIHMPDRDRGRSTAWRSTSKRWNGARRPNTNGSTTCCATPKAAVAGSRRFCGISARPRPSRLPALRQLRGGAAAAAGDQGAGHGRACSTRCGSCSVASAARARKDAAANNCWPKCSAARIAKGVTRNRLDKLSTYGLLAHMKQPEVVELVDALLAGGLSGTDRHRTVSPRAAIDRTGRRSDGGPVMHR